MIGGTADVRAGAAGSSPRRGRGRPHRAAPEEGPAVPLAEEPEAAMPLYEGLGSGGEKTAVVIDLGEAFTK